MKTIELLLLETVGNTGIVGDVVKVKAGYARNYLLPRGLATTPTPELIEQLSERRAEAEAELKRIRAEQSAMIEKIADYELTLERSCNDQGVLYGGVTQHEIAEALREAGFAVEDRFVRLGDQIKRVDTFHLPIVIDKELKTDITLIVASDRPLEVEEETAGEEEGEDGEPVESAEASEEAPAETADA